MSSGVEYIFYDENCSFCYRMAQRFIKRFPRNVLLTCQSDPYALELMNKHNSWVFRRDDQYYVEFSAFLELIKQKKSLRPLAHFLSLQVPCWFGTKAYRLISNNRNFWSKFL